MKTPDIRMAACSLCGTLEPSTPDLDYFRPAEIVCSICGFPEQFHKVRGRMGKACEHEFQPVMPKTDFFWCGCRDESKANANHSKCGKKNALARAMELVW